MSFILWTLNVSFQDVTCVSILEIWQENPYIVEIGQNYRPFCVRVYVHLYCYSTIRCFVFGQTTGGTYCCIFMERISRFILLTEPCAITYKGNPLLHFGGNVFWVFILLTAAVVTQIQNNVNIMCTLPVLLMCDICKILQG